MHPWVGFIHGVQTGIARFFAERPHWIWSLQLPWPIVIDGLDRVCGSFDGVITYAETEYFDKLRSLPIPVVNVSGRSDKFDLPAVLLDHTAIGRVAAEYLLALGLRHFAQVGTDELHFSRQHRKGFGEALSEKGHGFDRFAPPESGQASVLPLGIDPNVITWLKGLPKPVGIFVSKDVWALDLLKVAGFAKVEVPEDVCVLGVDNDELLTQLSYPPLSSIAVPAQAVGYEAAALLERLMDGQPAPAQPILLKPGEVVVRQSTNLLAIADPDIRAAVRYIRDPAHRQVTVTDLLELVPLNRRYFERKFRRHLGRTPLQEILRVRVDRAKSLLASSDLTMTTIARQSGFASAEQLATMFHKLTGLTPTRFRREHRHD